MEVRSSYITLDNIEFTGLMVRTNDTSAQNILIAGLPNGNVLMENLKIHNWDYCRGPGNPVAFCAAAVTKQDSDPGGIYVNFFAGIPITGIIVDHSDIGDPETPGDFGTALRGVEQVTFSNIHDCTTGLLHGGRIVHDNTFSNIGKTFDNFTHTNVIYLDTFNGGGPTDLPASTPISIYNNAFKNSFTNQIIYPNYGTAGVASGAHWYIFNNVIYGTFTDFGIVVEIDPFLAGSTFVVNLHVFNNTFEDNNTGWEVGKNNNLLAVRLDAYKRYDNLIGNVLGTSGIQDAYETYPGGPQTGTPIYALGGGDSAGGVTVPNDPRVYSTVMRWGNYDTVTGTVQWNANEVPPESACTQTPSLQIKYFPPPSIYSPNPAGGPSARRGLRSALMSQAGISRTSGVMPIRSPRKTVTGRWAAPRMAAVIH